MKTYSNCLGNALSNRVQLWSPAGVWIRDLQMSLFIYTFV